MSAKLLHKVKIYPSSDPTLETNMSITDVIDRWSKWDKESAAWGEIIKWCGANVGQCSIDWDAEIKNRHSFIPVWCFSFKRKSDAILFTLRWK